jgi:hypothetical protein
MSLFVALTNNDLLDIIFQRAEITFTLFHIGDFRFTLIEEEDREMIQYRVSYGNNFNISVTFLGVDSRDWSRFEHLSSIFHVGKFRTVRIS